MANQRVHKTVSDIQSILTVENLKKHYPKKAGAFKQQRTYIRAVDGVNLDLREGETLGLVGESGCGKSTVAKCIVRVVQPTEGTILFRTEEKIVDIATLPRHDLKGFRRHIQMVFQDPFMSLNPRLPVHEIVGEPLQAFKVEARKIKDRVAELLDLVGLQPEHMQRMPHAFSGGQRQRIGIARALALGPKIIIADEPISALDVSVQAQVLNLLRDLQERMGLSLLFVAHDLSVIRYISHRVAVMYLGLVVETASTEELFSKPSHPYTAMLLKAIPDADPDQDWLGNTSAAVQGEIDESLLMGKELNACPFAPRCRYATQECVEAKPPLAPVGNSEELPGNQHLAACFHADQVRRDFESS